MHFWSSYKFSCLLRAQCILESQHIQVYTVYLFVFSSFHFSTVVQVPHGSLGKGSGTPKNLARSHVLVAKVLTNSDTHGRIILPRVSVEANLTFLMGYRQVPIAALFFSLALVLFPFSLGLALFLFGLGLALFLFNLTSCFLGAFIPGLSSSIWFSV